MIGHRNDRFTLSPGRRGADVRVDDEGYLHTGRSQRHPDRVVVTCGHTGGQR